MSESARTDEALWGSIYPEGFLSGQFLKEALHLAQ